MVFIYEILKIIFFTSFYKKYQFKKKERKNSKFLIKSEQQFFQT